MSDGKGMDHSSDVLSFTGGGAKMMFCDAMVTI
jgi:hypothetical protein